MKIAGKEWQGEGPLTVGALKKYIAECEKRIGKSFDDHLVHFLQMEGPIEGDDHSSYASHVELDVYDVEDPWVDSPTSVPVLSLVHWPHREKATAEFLVKVEESFASGEKP